MRVNLLFSLLQALCFMLLTPNIISIFKAVFISKGCYRMHAFEYFVCLVNFFRVLLGRRNKEVCIWEGEGVHKKMLGYLEDWVAGVGSLS